jgi:hypothetical protein
VAVGLGQQLQIKLREPVGTLRAGTSVTISVDVTIAEPWFPVPCSGSKIASISGRPESGATCYETRGPQTIAAPFGGTLRIEDTRIDVHTPTGFPDAGAGPGVVATLRHESGVELRFGHLERGSTPSLTRVRAGEAIGRTGNTGRCVDGCGRSVVSVQLKAAGGRRMEQFNQPLKLRASFGDKLLTGLPMTIPAGATQLSRVKLGNAKASRKPGKKTTPLKIELVRGTAAQAIAVFETELRVDL